MICPTANHPKSGCKLTRFNFYLLNRFEISTHIFGKILIILAHIQQVNLMFLYTSHLW